MPATICAQQATPTVNVITAEKRPITESVRFVGRIQAIERVDVRARVTGFLEDVLFKDGEQRKDRRALYRIEKGPFEASVQQAKANVLRAHAQLDNATIQRQRAEDLLKTSSGSVANRDDRIAAEKDAAGGSSRSRSQPENSRDQSRLYRHHFAH